MRNFTRSREIVVAALLTLGITLTASSAHAQHFGGNKVQYKKFKFEVLRTEHFDNYFYAEERDAAGQVARMAERWYAPVTDPGTRPEWTAAGPGVPVSGRDPKLPTQARGSRCAAAVHGAAISQPNPRSRSPAAGD